MKIYLPSMSEFLHFGISSSINDSWLNLMGMNSERNSNVGEVLVKFSQFIYLH